LEFHEDLFPEVFSQGSALTGTQWLDGNNKTRQRESMNPQKRQSTPTKSIPGKEISLAESTDITLSQIPESVSTVTASPTISTPTKEPFASQLPSNYTRKFLIGRTKHPNTHFTYLPQIPTTSSLHRMLSATSTHLAFPIAGPAGRIAILALNSPGRHENPPTFSNGSALVDFSLCPYTKFHGEQVPLQIICAGEDGRVILWKISNMTEISVEKVALLEGMEKIIQVEWHPYVYGLITILCIHSGTYEIRLWDSTKSFQRIPLSYSVVPS
jgi:WD40 repeat protein